MEIDLIDSILSCEDLYVILENRWGDRYVESYKLPNILYSDGKYWGKFRNVHGAYGHPNIEDNQILSYAYNNFSNVVCTSGMINRYERFYSSHAYGSLKFITRNKYNKIWSSIHNDNTNELLNSVNKGFQLKFLLKSLDNYTYILPIHTIEVYENETRFSLYTDYDGYPDKLRYFSSISKSSEKFDILIARSDATVYPTTKCSSNNDFFLTYFYFDNGILKQLTSINSKISHSSLNFEKIEIWSEY